MKRINSLLLSGTCAVLVSVAAAGHAQADSKGLTIPGLPMVQIGGSLRGQYIQDENNDLGTGASDSSDSESLEAKLRATAHLSDTTTAFTEVRGILNYGAGNTIDLDTGETSGRKDFLELRQLWIQQDAWFGQLPWSTRIGRQRFSEPYGLWWNRDFDAARISYDTTLFNAYLAAGQNLMSYRTSGDDYQRDDEDIFRVLSEASWQWKYNHFVEARFSYQNDHSGMEGTNTFVDSDNRDSEDGEFYWAGIRLRGETPDLVLPNAAPVKYRLDLLGVTGEADTQLTAAAPGNLRRVTGKDSSDVLGWAVDAGLDIPLPVYANPELLLGYAYGSGDDGTGGTDHNFRQTGLDSNNSRYGLASGTLYHYGFVLRPDLSNIHILTAGMGVPVMKASDLTAVYHYYRLDEDATSLLTSGVDASLNGTDKDLGQAVDVVLNVSLMDELNLNAGPLRGINLKTTLGAFKAGGAFGNAEDEVASRGLMELQFRF